MNSRTVLEWLESYRKSKQLNLPSFLPTSLDLCSLKTCSLTYGFQCLE